MLWVDDIMTQMPCGDRVWVYPSQGLSQSGSISARAYLSLGPSQPQSISAWVYLSLGLGEKGRTAQASWSPAGFLLPALRARDQTAAAAFSDESQNPDAQAARLHNG